MTKDSLTQEDLERLKAYIEEMEAKVAAGEEVSKSSLKTWLEKMGIYYLLDKLGEAWDYISELIVDMF